MEWRWRGESGEGQHTGERGEVGGKTVKWEKILTVLHRGEGKWQLPGWTGQTGRVDRSTVAPRVPEKNCPDYPGEIPEYPGIAQSIRAEIQTIRELTMKKF